MDRRRGKVGPGSGLEGVELRRNAGGEAVCRRIG